MKAVRIENHRKDCAVTVMDLPARDETPAKVMIFHNAGAMDFQFVMTPEEARAMAAALIEAADEIEAGNVD